MPDVTIFTRRFCGFCSEAKTLLASKGIEYAEYDGTLDQDIRAEMVKRSKGASTFPQIFIGEKHVGGCDELHKLEHAGALDALLED